MNLIFLRVRSLSVNSPSLRKPVWRSLWQFSRPHTIIGTSLSVWALALLAANPINLFGEYGIWVLFAWGACLGGNVFIVGLNQLTDIEIDKINKPHLPVAAGDFSAKTGWGIVLAAGAIAIILSVLSGLWLTITVVSSLIIGTLYSLPPVRLKRFPLLAAMCIFTVRGVVVNLGLFAHFRERLGETVTITPTVWLLTAFIIVFTVAIAIFKDVPDMEGDKQYRIRTFTLLMGKQKIFQISLAIIGICYAGMIGGVWLFNTTLNPIAFTLAHIALAIALTIRSRAVNLERKAEIASFYQFIWKLFFLEYILFMAVNVLP